MAAIFISHCSQDNQVAAELAERLRGRGFGSLFLDFDPEQGIPGGRSWEKELYARLRSAQAVLVLCSPASMASNWVFAEITHARALGKAIVPLRLAPCEQHSILRDLQRIDLFPDREAGYRRLWRALVEAGLDPTDLQQWHSDRSPYPGLEAFDEADSAVFFGRDADIRAGIEAFNRIRRFGGSPLMLFLGPSGSGKSSLVRAGILPRLHRASGWQVLPPIRPRSQALAALARGLSGAAPSDACRRLANGDPSAFAACLESVREGGDQVQSWTLLLIDQLEELFDPDNRDNADRLIQLIRQVHGGAIPRLILAGVMRSDFLDDLQSHPQLKTLDFHDQAVRPLALEDLRQVITEPARLAGIELEPGLAEQMVADTGSADALPLLAFALRELWERCGSRGRISLDDYRTELGGISGSIRRAADGVLAAADPDAAALEALHSAFRRLVRINEEGHYARRVAPLDELPGSSRPLLQRFVAARLLVAGKDGDQLEVAHEALFRVWPTLRGWLDQDREFLLWRRRLQPSVEQWTRAPTPLRDAPLDEAERWYQRRQQDLNVTERELIGQSLALRDEARRRRRRRLGGFVGGLAGVTLLVSALLAIALTQWRAATRNEALARTRLEYSYWLSGVGYRDERNDSVLAGHHFARSAGERLQGTAPLEALAFLAAGSCLRHIIAPPQVLEGAAFDPDFRRLLTWSASGQLQLRDAAGASVAELPHPGIRGAVFSGDGRLLTWGGDGGIRLWQADTGRLLARLSDASDSRGARFSPGNEHILGWFGDGDVGIWNTQQQLINETLHREEVLLAAFTPDGRFALSLGRDRTIRAMPVTGGSSRRLGHSGLVVGMAAGDGTLLSWDAEGRVYLWDLAQGRLRQQWGDEAGGPFNGASFLDAGQSILLWNREGRLQVRNLIDGSVQARFRHPRPLTGVRVAPDGQRIAGWDSDGEIRVWSRDGQSLHQFNHQDAVTGVRFSPDGSRLLSWSRDRSARLWSLGGGPLPAYPMYLSVAPADATFDTDAQRIAVWGRHGSIRLWALAPAPDSPLTEATQLDVRPAADGRSLLSLSLNGTLQSWSPDGHRAAAPIPLASPSLQRGRLSADSRWLLAQSGGTLKLWSVGTGAPPVSFAPLPADFLDARLSGDGSVLLSWGGDGFAQLWRSADGRLLGQLPHGQPVLDAEIGPDGEIAITSDAGFEASLWHLPDQRLIRRFRFDQDGVDRIALSPDGRLALATGLGGQVQVWDAHSGEAKAGIVHGPEIQGALFSPDGARFLSWDRSGLIRQWHSADGSEAGPSLRHVPSQPDSSLQGLAFSADGQRLLSWDNRNSLRVWNLAEGRAISPRLNHDTAIAGAGLWNSDPPRLYAWGGRKISLWPLPEPVTAADPLLLQALLTGTRLTKDGTLEVLDAVQWQADLHAWSSSGEPAPCRY